MKTLRFIIFVLVLPLFAQAQQFDNVWPLGDDIL